MEDNEKHEEASREESREKADKPQSGKHSAEVLQIFHELEDFFGDEQAKKLISTLAKLPEKLIVSLWWGANQDREIYYKDIAEHSGLPVSVIHKEISQVVLSGTKKSGQHLMPLKCNVPRHKAQTPKRARPKQPKQQTPAPERKPTEKKKETEDERRKRRKAEWKRKNARR